MDLDKYLELGGRYTDITQKELDSLLLRASAYLAKIEESFVVKYPPLTDPDIIMVALVDVVKDNSIVAGQGTGGDLSSISVGSYKETRRRADTASASRRNASAGGLEQNLWDVLSKYCVLYRKRIGQIW